ncbi:MAG TPA: hypothetical protein VIC57_09080 [Candidatus Dormibacteraeota bacterium]
MEFDIPFVVVTNLVPYGIVAAIIALRRAGHARRWTGVVLVAATFYALAIALAPVGAVARAREGWGWYASLFVLLGGLTWLSFGGWWLVYAAWADLYKGVHGRPPTLRLNRRAAPALFATAALTLALMPWVWPASSLPGGSLSLLAMTAVVIGSIVLAGAVNVSERAPRFLLPRDLAEMPQPVGQPFWVDALFVAVMLLLGGAFILAIQDYTQWPGWATRLLIVPVLVVTGVAAFVVSRFVSKLVHR